MKATQVSPAKKSPKATKASAVTPGEEATTAAEAATEAQPNADDRETFIRRTAYAYYEERGRVHGYELDDWLKAEAEFELMTGGAADAAQAH